MFTFLSLCHCFRTVVFSWMTKRVTAVIHWKATCSATAATSTDCSRRSLPTRPPATPSMSLNCEGGERWATTKPCLPRNPGHQQWAKKKLPAPSTAVQGKLSMAMWASGRGLTHTVQLPPHALSVVSLGKRVPLLFHQWSFPAHFPWVPNPESPHTGSPRGPGDVTPPDPCTFIKERVFGM